jgi:hypothetical protein
LISSSVSLTSQNIFFFSFTTSSESILHNNSFFSILIYKTLSLSIS